MSYYLCLYFPLFGTDLKLEFLTSKQKEKDKKKQNTKETKSQEWKAGQSAGN